MNMELPETPRFLETINNQVIDLNCCFLKQEEDGTYSCRRDLDGAELESCEDCTLSMEFMKNTARTC